MSILDKAARFVLIVILGVGAGIVAAVGLVSALAWVALPLVALWVIARYLGVV